MNQYSSTLLKLFDTKCPAALGFYEAGEPAFREIFQCGIAAHAVLQVVGEKGAKTPEDIHTVAEAVTLELITEGRSFKGTPEPPMSPEAAFEGRDLAVNWLSWNELPDGQCEIQLCMDEHGHMIRDLSPHITCNSGTATDEKGAIYAAGSPRYDAIIDMVYEAVDGTEDEPLKTIVVRDYKSAWPTNADELDTLQRKGQAVLVWLHHPDVAGITREVINLRTGAVYRDTTWLDDEGVKTLTQWRDDILTLCRAADATREARPGVGCIDCPYVLRCEPAAALLSNKERPANQYAVAKAIVDATGAILKVQAKQGPIMDGFGGQIGYKATVGRAPDLEELAGQLAVLWDKDNISGLVMALRPGITSLNNIMKVLYPGKEGKFEREDMTELCTIEKRGSRFTAW